MERVKRALAHPGAGWLCAALACLLGLPALTVGLVADDYWLLARTSQTGLGVAARGPLDLFDWYRRDEIPVLKERGILPWPTSPESEFSLWRPLASITHWLDWTLWPAHPLLMHAQNLAWLAALVLLVHRLQRELIGPTWTAGLAALLYAVDDARSVPAGWIAGRNALVAALFGLAAFWLHLCWRRRSSRLAALLAPLSLLVGLLSNEGTVAVCAYVAGYAALVETGPVRHRVLSLVPSALVVIAWRIAYDLLGYGVSGKSFYIDPLESPWRFGLALLSRGPALFLGLWGLPPSDVWILPVVPDAARVGLWIVAAALLVGVTALFWPSLKQDRMQRFWFWSMLLSLVPTCAVAASDRLLVFAGVGATALLATFLAGVHDGYYRSGFASERLKRGFYRAFIAIHLVLAPILFVVNMQAFKVIWSRFERGLRSAELGTCADKTVVLVDGPHPFVFFAALRLHDGQPVPWRIRQLGPPAGGALRVRRVDERTLVVRPRGGFPGGHRRWAVGDRELLPGMTVEIREVDRDHRPLEVAYVFDVPLEDESFVWLEWQDSALRPFRPPAIGAALSIADD
jgi:hypothetical protein